MSRGDRFQAKDKITHKMTRDGLVEVNAATGEEDRISRRGQNFNLQRGKAPQQEALVREPGKVDTASLCYDLLTGNIRSSQTVQSGKVNGKPQNIDQTDTPFESTVDTSLHGRLNFDKEQTAPADKSTLQQGMAYYQRFKQDVAHPPERQPAPQAGETGVQNTTPPIPSPQDVPASRQTASSGKVSGSAPKPGRLRFSSDEQTAPERKLTKAQRKAERTEEKQEKAWNQLPKRKKLHAARGFDEKQKKQKHKINFEAEVKSQQSHLKGALPLRPARAGANLSAGYAHNKLFQVERENVGTEAAHKGELLAEGGLRTACRLYKTAPYRRAAKLERLSVKHNANLAYQKLLHENPQLRSNPLSRFIQKQKIKRRYAKAARESKQAAGLLKQAGAAGGKFLKLASGFVRSHPMLIGGIALLLLVIFSFSTLLASCTNMAMGGLPSLLMSSYTADDADIDDAELTYTEWETDLQMRIQKAQEEHPGYDEYRYNVDDIGHAPLELLAYLSAKYQDFTFADVKAELQRIFNEQYRLEFVAQTETRYRTETRTDPETGESYTVKVHYEWHILNVKLTSRPFTDVVKPALSEDEREMYGLYMQTKGNRQYIESPFNFDWMPYIACYYGWRIHPVTGAKDYHKGIDISVPIGTDILAGHDGKVTQAAFDADSYGYYIVLEGKDGLVSKYAHCDRLLASIGQQVKKGDVIAKSGNTGRSTGPHLHLEVLKNGHYLNPLFFAESPDSASERQ